MGSCQLWFIIFLHVFQPCGLPWEKRGSPEHLISDMTLERMCGNTCLEQKKGEVSPTEIRLRARVCIKRTMHLLDLKWGPGYLSRSPWHHN